MYKGKLRNLVGGAGHVHKLLPSLEMLVCGEESSVRAAVSLIYAVLFLKCWYNNIR